MTVETWQQGIAQAADAIVPYGTIGARPIDYIEGHMRQWRPAVRAGAVAGAANLRQFYENVASAAFEGLSRSYAEGWDSICRFVADKQRDYGHGNILAFEHIGLIVRISDKVARIRNLEARGSAGTVEPLADAWVDIVGYCLVGLMLLDGTFTLPLAEDAPASPHLETVPPAPLRGVDGAGPWEHLTLDLEAA